ncbi:MAG: polynucleotide kinase 3 phosphatase-domain-containing protein [Monoraphidium minutum]|nr:MAG: polynucleotide kinase 3 phosphatase-domain-containing protein [Monoraphidium minutum]
MAPKKGKKSEFESEEASEFEPSASASESSGSEASLADSDASDDSGAAAKRAKKAAPPPPPKPAPKAAAPKKKISAVAAPKGAPKASPASHADAGGAGGDAASPGSKRKRAPAAKKAFAPAEDDPWSYEENSLIWRDFGSTPSEKIAAFDLDGTLIITSSGNRFAAHSADWRFFNKKVEKVVKEYAEDGYKVVIFSNQGSIRSALGGKAADNVKRRVEAVVEKLGVPVQVFMAPQKDKFRKPEPGMWEFMIASCNGGLKPFLEDSFFVGDAAGRDAATNGGEQDFSDSDKEFAAKIGLPFKLPEDVFGAMEGKKDMDPRMRAAGRDALESGDGPNAALLAALSEYAENCFTHAKAISEDKFKWKGMAMKKAVTALATFSAPITLSNTKDVLKLPGVGKGTIDKIKEFIATGAVVLEGFDDADVGAKREAVTTVRQEQAMAFI